MPPPPLVFHNSPPPDRYLSDQSEFIPSYAPGTRRLAQPIPIDPIPPTTEPHSYSLGSQETIMSDISDSLRPSPPPLTTASTAGLPTPYTLRTPAVTSRFNTTARPIITTPISPSADITMENDNGNGLVRVKSFPHSGDLLGSSNEASTSRRATPPEIDTHDVVMGSEEQEALGVQQTSPISPTSGSDGHMEEEGTVRLGSSAPRGSLTRLLRDIGNPTESSSTSPHVPAYIQPFLDDRARVFGSRWSQPPQSLDSSSSSSSRNAEIGSHRSRIIRSNSDQGQVISDVSDFNELGPLPSASDSNRNDQSLSSQYESARPQAHFPYAQSRPYSPTFSGGFMTGNWGEAYTSYSAPPPLTEEHRSNTEPSRIAPSRSQRPASPSAISSDLRTLPSPISHTHSGSPSSVERRLDTIEARLDRVRGRNQRSPTTPPMLAPMHAYEGMRNRSNASRPYDISSRSRPSTQVTEDGSRRLSSTRAAVVRPSWMEPSSATAHSPTVPPPRPRPALSFGWESSDTNPTSSSDIGRSSQPSTRRAAEEDDERVSPSSHDLGVQRENVRSRYLQARLNMLENVRTGQSTSARISSRPNWAHLPAAHRPHLPWYEEEGIYDPDDSDPSVYNRPNWPGSRPPWVNNDHQDRSDGSIPFIAENSHPTQSRPANRRWMSFDEGERERGPSRTRTNEEHRASPSNVAEQNPINALNRDVNEVVGRRLSQPRLSAEAMSIARRLREQLGPDWDDARLTDPHPSASTSGGRAANEPARSRIGSLFGEMDDTAQRDTSNSTSVQDPLDMYLGNHERRIAMNELAARRREPFGGVGMGAGEEAEFLFLERLRSQLPLHSHGHGDDSDTGLLRIGRNGPEPPLNSLGLLEGMMDVGSPDSPFAIYQSFRRFNSSSGELFGNIKITDEMGEKERMKIVRVVIKSMARLPHQLKRKGAENTLKVIKYEAFEGEESKGATEGMEKDEYCSVCHDDYEPTSEIAITPCKHMYHKGCLDTWLNTPNTSSCPMCRRDLAALSYLTKMVPTKTLEEAIPLWMAVVS
ncbi:hypothetical protein I302_103370 [Kwoniella bestiolae CBS 10118]|uniref:RING-type domain-containing protein n=1 Tax=Kwoniella bestiolae CBS 10118 TaxID=1296100 RepID=A0A1B9G8A8_9TREE|nr:hypothetical protein I302_02071 [Kwoniella bestiolae CBS 10118]OCF27231.1 hypothetical protein I302_02071 [Kwoniella bestiolae CBS 10118]